MNLNWNVGIYILIFIVRKSEPELESFVFLANVNHKLLQSMQLSMPVIDRLSFIADE